MTKPIPGPAPAKQDMTESYSAVQTVQYPESDLLTRVHLDNARDVHRLIESRSHLSPYQDRELAVKILNKLLSYHTDIIEKLIEEGKSEFVVDWSIDLNKLQLAVQLVKEIDLTDD